MSNRVFIIAEVGINANGDMNIAKKLIDAAVDADCDAIKFQKRTIDAVYTKEELDKERESPWGTTNRQQKEGLEFSKEDYDKIDRYCKEKNIVWFASAWDKESQEFLRQYDLKYNKIASAMLTDKEFLKMVASEGRYTYISTGMSTMEQVEDAVGIFEMVDCPFELMHCCSVYPMEDSEANLAVIDTLRNRFRCDVGYSGHEKGLVVSCAAVALGASSIERHITLDRAMYGSDQAASLEVTGLKKLVVYIRAIETAIGSSIKTVSKKEAEIAKKLRKV